MINDVIVRTSSLGNNDGCEREIEINGCEFHAIFLMRPYIPLSLLVTYLA